VRKENRRATGTEWEQITSCRLVVHRIPERTPEPEEDAEKLERIAGEALDMHLESEDTFRRANLEIEELEELPQNRTV